LAGQCYALAIPQDYYFWDVLATAYLAHPEFYQLREWETVIVTTGLSLGRTKVESGGRKIWAMNQVDKSSFTLIFCSNGRARSPWLFRLLKV
jgi:purine nucleosidase